MNEPTQNKSPDDLEFRQDKDKSVNTAGESYSRSSMELPPGEAPGTRGPGPVAPSEDDRLGDYAATTAQLGDDTWLIQQAQEMYTNSTDYLDANITNFWERNLAHFHSEHAPGSVYRRKGFRRSRVFRPRTRANVKQQEAGLANAAFSTLNLIDIQPQNPKDPEQIASAQVNSALLQYRLEHTMPWFLTVQGAYQNTKVYGLCASHQYWNYHEDIELTPEIGEDGEMLTETDEEGNVFALASETPIVHEDKMCCDLMEAENLRFDPMCDWRDPATTSPYVIRMMPIYAQDALQMMKKGGSRGSKQSWRRYSLAEILATRRQDYDRTRQAREGRDRIDPADENHGNEFTTIWAHMNIVKVGGEDYVYWTMGTELVLTDPVPLKEDYPWTRRGERPFVIGYSNIETHRNYPAGDVELSAPVQEEINDIANQRMDNVKLVLNKRYFVKRGSQVDLDALVRNTPGGGVMMNDPENDVNVLSTPDVTGSSYNEQAMLAQEMDTLIGGYDPNANQSSSVGGQQLGASAANAVQDYGIKIFIETWMEPVVRQLQRLVAMYETDEVLLAIAGDMAPAMKRFGMDEITDSLLMKNLTVRVDIGMGNTDPMRRVERLVFGVGKVAEMPGMATRIKGGEVSNEIFGALGYRDASRFIMTDEEHQQYMEENPPGPGEIEVKMRELDIRDEDNKMRDDRERLKLEVEDGHRLEDRLAKQDMKLDELMSSMNQSNLARESSAEQNQTSRDVAAANLAAKTKEKNEEATKPTPEGGSK